ncbi:fumarylacetoacetate hydrolase family protein [uncultured Duncaniella sp.]|uniref:fumarylacetoacetate hydrolase family protein n=1 Tax=uncultured Duncaniella sp. TaxID=2768039 RepID=UPI002636253F|nr:fumarylacetoacetate hydrolase family protein [uncultured Duncaniella sp.]
MKIIRLISLSPALDIDIHPDSAMILPGRPFFMPEWGENWVAKMHPAVRIGRLGKNIARKFAARYYDGVTMAFRVTLADAAGLEGVLSGMDSSLIHGEWLPAECASRELSVGVNGEAFAVGPFAETVDEVIAKVSEYMTLKMGDVILLPAVGQPVNLKEGLRVEVSVDSTPVMELRVV